jgi:hypothetical protein
VASKSSTTSSGGEGEDPLGEQPALGVGDEAGVAGVGNGVVESVDQSELFVSLAEDQNAGVGGDLTAREIGMNDASSQAENGKAFVVRCVIATAPVKDQGLV